MKKIIPLIAVVTLFKVFLVVSIVSVACNEQPPPPPPPTTTTTAVEPPPPPPPTDYCVCGEQDHPDACQIDTPRKRRPSCSYLTLSTAAKQVIELQKTGVIWFARNFAYAANPAHCDPTLPPFRITREELRALSEEAHILHDGGREIDLTDTIGNPSRLYFLENLLVENPRYPGRSKVYKPKWGPWKEMFDIYVAIAGEVDSRSPVHDGIRHFCQEQEK